MKEESVSYHINRAITEQLRGQLSYKRNVNEIYEDMLDEWLPQGPHINDEKQYLKKRMRGPHRRAAKKIKQNRIKNLDRIRPNTVS
jgi:hypothetical protein